MRAGILCLATALSLAALPPGAQSSPVVREVRLEGNDHFDRSTLIQLMRTRTRSPLSRSVFDPRIFIQDLDNLAAFYVSEGFLDVRVHADPPAWVADSTRVDLRIVISEGERWTVCCVQLSGTTVIHPEALNQRLQLQPGGFYGPLLLPVDERAILDQYAARGYLDTRVFRQTALDRQARTVSIRYRIVEGPEASVSKVTLLGLARTRPSTVLRELDFAVGDRFDLDRWGRSQSNLYTTGLFDWVWIQPALADTGEAEKEVQILVGEKPAWAISTGVGYGRFDRERLVGSVRQGNVLGRGIRCGLEGKVSRKTRRAELNVSEPWLLGRRLAAHATAAYHWRDEPEFLAESVEGGVLLSRALRPRVFAEGGYRLTRTLLLDVEPSAAARDRLNRTSTLGAAVTWKMRDDLFNTTRGFFLRLEGEYAGTFLGGTNQFLRTNVFWRHFVPLPGRVVLAFNTRLGAMTPLQRGGIIAINERYFMGGDRSVRGYPRHSLGPAEGGRPRGARKIGEFGQEIRFPIARRLLGVAFCDEGILFDAEPRRDDWAVGAGAGLRLVTPFGVVRAEAARGLTERWGTGTEYYLSVGQAF